MFRHVPNGGYNLHDDSETICGLSFPILARFDFLAFHHADTQCAYGGVLFQFEIFVGLQFKVSYRSPLIHHIEAEKTV